MTGMLTGLGLLAEALGANLETMLALFCRLGGFIALLPGLGAQTLPVRVKLSLGLALTALLLPLTTPTPEGELIPLVLTEAFQGLFLGFGIRVFVFALGVTGSVIAQALSLSQLFGVSAEGDSSGAVSNALVMAAVTMFLTADLEVVALARFVEHLAVVPLGYGFEADSAAMAERALDLTAEAFALGVMLAAPFMVLNFAFYILLGLLNRAMPQLMVTFVGLPGITLGGLVLLMLTAGALLTAWAAKMGGILS
ncbi:flagellar biosynthetic protein FliR [Parvularcula maris]|uniref:Flagellar biosynthetic protein FliR n=1 Tax=Parvularcula maris TaxID=2965077 RepID=A0A9X2L882_9PROT|nr:flagellar biosynthetic protein FliR [Parvularcula maris]MCQ8184913.1 flagellar biosynthetic protein FliR [Parvularcula maris]